MLKKDEIRQLDANNIEKEVQKTKKECFEARFKLQTGQSKSTDKPKKLRRQVARLRTIKSQKLAEIQ